jgi:hypothetical protein
MTRFSRFAIMLAASAIVARSASAAVAPPGYPLLVDQHGMRVYGPADRAKVGCPSGVLPLPANALSEVERAVTLAMVPFAARVRLDGRSAQVRATRSGRSPFDAAAGACGATIWRRSVVASVRLPHVVGAAMAQDSFAVARLRGAWVLYAWILG